MRGGKRLLGLDYGESKIGLALSDELGLTAQPLKTFKRRCLKDDLAELTGVVELYDVGEIVMGIPRNMDGTYGEGAKRVRHFAKMLAEKIAVDIRLWDERLSTRAAKRTMIELGTKRAKKKDAEDRLSAQFILQGYLDNKGRKSART